MNMCVQIVLCFLVYALFYRIYSDSQVGISSCCYNEDIDDTNETIELEHDIERLEEILSLPHDILEALNRESEGSKPNIEETEVANLADEGENEKPIKIGVNFPKDLKHELITLLKEFREIFAWSYQDMPGLDTKIVVHNIPIKSECPPSATGPSEDEIWNYFEDQRSGKAVESWFPYHDSLLRLGRQHCSRA